MAVAEEAKGFLYGWLGKRSVVPEYTIRSSGKKINWRGARQLEVMIKNLGFCFGQMLT